MFTGPSGCGKTTLGRILAEELGCNIEFDFTEINAANNRGIDTAREIMSITGFAPKAGKSSIILIDECQATTKDFQQALLKPLEDTPDHIYFILCTTDPNKIIQTIKNRCTTFEVKRLDKKEIVELVDWVSKEVGGAKLEKEISEELFYVSEGCPRQALVVLDKILDLKPAEQLKALKDISITEESKEVIALINAFLKSKKHDWKTISDVLKDIPKEDLEKTRWAILGYMNKVLLGGKAPDADNAAIIINNFSEPFYDSGNAGLTLACWDSFKDIISF